MAGLKRESSQNDSSTKQLQDHGYTLFYSSFIKCNLSSIYYHRSMLVKFCTQAYVSMSHHKTQSSFFTVKDDALQTVMTAFQTQMPVELNIKLIHIVMLRATFNSLPYIVALLFYWFIIFVCLIRESHIQDALSTLKIWINLVSEESIF